MRAEPDKPLRIALQEAGGHFDRVPEAFVAPFNRGRRTRQGLGSRFAFVVSPTAASNQTGWGPQGA
jgi:hypothetical protein